MSRSLRYAVAALPIAIAVAIIGVGGADAARADIPPPQPIISTAPIGVAPLPDEIAPASDYGPSRPVPNLSVVAPARPERLHPMKPMPTVAPIVPPPYTLRAGYLNVPMPTWAPMGAIDVVNNWAATQESEWSTMLRAKGVAPTLADTQAAQTVGQWAQQAAATCVILAIPASIVPVLGTAVGCGFGLTVTMLTTQAMTELMYQLYRHGAPAM